MNFDDFTRLQYLLSEKHATVCMPTDTQYGLVCRAEDKKAVDKLFKIKGREGKSGTIIAASAERLRVFGVSDDLLSKASKFWPNAVSIALRCSGEFEYLHKGKNSPVFRVPKPEWLRELLERTGPLMTTSANIPGKEPVSTTEEARKLFGDHIALYIDGGELIGQLPSTIIELTTSGYKVLREGAVLL